MKKIKGFLIYPLTTLSLMSGFVFDSSADTKTIPNGYTELYSGIYISKTPGYYSTEQTLSFSVDDNLELYYSLNYDNSDVSAMTLYEKPFKVNKSSTNNIVNYPVTKSVDAILPDDTEGKCVSDTYINNIQKTGNYVLFDKQPVVKIAVIDKETKQTVFKRSLTYIISDKVTENIDIPVISLSLPYEDIMGENGFYNKIREDISKRADLEYFDSKYNEYFYRNTQVKLGGNWTLGYPQRTLNLNFNKDENGKKNDKVNEHVFENRTKRADSTKRLTNLTRIRLHNGGNAFESSTRINDAILQEIMKDGYAATTGYRPAVVYINGEYWGLMSIREQYKDVYFENNYDVDKDNVITYDLKGTWSVDEGDETVGITKLNEMESYLSNNDFRNDTVYQQFIDKYLDIHSFLDVVLAHAYSGNWDFIGNFNNLKMWTVQEANDENDYEDGKFRFVLHDTDFAFTSYQNPLYPYHANAYCKFPLFQKLMSNDSFRDALYNRASELVNTILSPYNCMDTMNRMIDEVRPFHDYSSLRWGQKEEDLSSWNKDINDVFCFFEKKSSTFLNEIKNILCMY